jgi:glycosyltransferase involved in cell wall biosynthesis
MKSVVFDARSLHQRRDGLGSYLGELIPRIASSAPDLRITIVVQADMSDFWRSAVPGAAIIPSDCRSMWPSQNWHIPNLLRRLRPDLYFYPVHDPPVLVRCPLVFTLQDVTAHQIRPYYPRMDRIKTAYTRAVTEVALRQASRVLTSSEATKVAVGQIFGSRFLEKIRVVPFGANQASVSNASAHNGRSCLLYVGTDRLHKNVDRLILGYAAARARWDGLPPLEIVGSLRRETHLGQLIDQAGLRGRVFLRGHVPDDELERTYARALALVFPSLAEGFGLPILEAMGRGIPVITSNRSACPEVAGNAAVLVDPYDIQSIADGMIRVAADPLLREQLVSLGRARVSRFSWEQCASSTLDVLREALRGS